MSKIAIVVGNPMRDSYSEALGQAYLRGAESGGHEAKLFSARTHEFRRHPARRLPPRTAARARPGGRARQALAGPAITWCSYFRSGAGDMPAIMKGFIERVLQPDLLAIQKGGGSANWKFFKGKSARIIMTMGMPGWFYRWYYGAHALKLLRRNVLLSGSASRPVRSTIYGMIEAVGDQNAQAMAARGRGARPPGPVIRRRGLRACRSSVAKCGIVVTVR